MKDVTGVVREASHSDILQIVALINRAFAVERFFKSGDRTDPEQVRQMMEDGKFLLLMEEDEMVACLLVKVTGDRGYVGTLSVDPARQKSGIGRRMMPAVRNSGVRIPGTRRPNRRMLTP